MAVLGRVGPRWQGRRAAGTGEILGQSSCLQPVEKGGHMNCTGRAAAGGHGVQPINKSLWRESLGFKES